MSMYRVVYTRKGETKKRLHVASPTADRKKAQKIADDMNNTSEFFRWGKTFSLEVADHGKWKAA